MTFAPGDTDGHSYLMSTTLSVEEVLDLIEDAFGRRPTVNAVHLAVSRARTGSTGGSWRSSLTSGLPDALEDGTGLVFNRAEVADWIRTHPARAGERLQSELEADQRAVERVGAIGRAREAGLSWDRIARVIADVDDAPVSRELVRRVFMPLLEQM